MCAHTCRTPARPQLLGLVEFGLAALEAYNRQEAMASLMGPAREM